MSRNLMHVRCYECDAGRKGDNTIRHIEEPRPITEEDAGQYFGEFEGMLVADAVCTRCRTEYLAWVEPAPDNERRKYEESTSRYGHYDLSYRSTFNDEPADEDLGAVEVYEKDGEIKFKTELDRAKRQHRAREQMCEEVTNRIQDLEPEQVEMVLDVLHNPEQYRSLVELIDRVSGSDTTAPWRNW